MEGGQRATELIGIAADFVERDQAVVLVERGVFGALGHHRAGRLLKTSDEAQPVGQVQGVGAVAQQQGVADEVENRRVGARVAALGLGHGLLDRQAIVLARGASFRVDIGPIDAQSGDDFADDERQAVQGEVAMAAVTAGDVAQEIAQLVDFAGQRDEHDHFLGRVGQISKALGALAQKAKVDGAEELFVLTGDEQAVDDVQKVVAGSAADFPIGPESLAGFEDLFHHDIEVAVVCLQR